MKLKYNIKAKMLKSNCKIATKATDAVTMYHHFLLTVMKAL